MMIIIHCSGTISRVRCYLAYGYWNRHGNQTIFAWFMKNTKFLREVMEKKFNQTRNLSAASSDSV